MTTEVALLFDVLMAVRVYIAVSWTGQFGIFSLKMGTSGSSSEDRYLFVKLHSGRSRKTETRSQALSWQIMTFSYFHWTRLTPQCSLTFMCCCRYRLSWAAQTVALHSWSGMSRLSWLVARRLDQQLNGRHVSLWGPALSLWREVLED
jgi:hypothetical protein